ncbi:hypothetical protein BC628DRAFT_1339663 [Trametes gibbosa]|nr:hypothetical protein BC628DRAFT_1339663 [Trametes gibbosa]
MRSPALAFSLFAAVATVSAQATIGNMPPLTPALLSRGSEHPAALYSRPQDNRDADHRGAARAGRPQSPPHLNNVNHGKGDSNMNGGTSDTSPAVGSDAADGGESASSPDGSSAAGWDVFNVGSGIQDALSGTKSGVPNGPPAEPAGVGYKPDPQVAYSYQRMRRARVTSNGSANKRDDPLLRSGEGVTRTLESPNQDNPDNDNSNQDGPDGTSRRGSEVDGAGPYGGHAHSGQVGSSEGGKVYNTPASSD